MTVEVELAYLAGLIDGEGCISLHRSWGDYYQLRVVISNTDPTMIEWVGNHFGGYSRWEQSSKPDKWKSVYRLEWNGRKAATLLQSLLPYLVTKQAQAMLGIRFIAEGRDKTFIPVMKGLNKRGL